MNIVFCIDDNYVELAKVSIKSYRDWNPLAKIIIVSENKIQDDLDYDENIIIKLPKKFRNRGEGDRISNAAYLKCFLTELPYDKVLYVDPDTICQRSLKELYKTPVEYIGLCESHKFGEKQAEALGLSKYGLTGMMLMNLDNLRKIKFTDLCLDVEKNLPIPSTGWQHDETCINVALKDKLTFLDKKYDYCHNRKYDNPIKESEAVILHYVGDGKKDMPFDNRYPEISKIGAEIYGKRIAIVGNAKSIFDKSNGEEIDNHDFVIRFNRGFITEPKAQGTKTNMLLLACNLTPKEIMSYKPDYVVNRSNAWENPTAFVINNKERAKMTNRLIAQPSTGFIAIDICFNYMAASIDLYGFDFEKTPTFYNPEGYKTPHNYTAEEEAVLEYERRGRLKIH